MAPEPTSDKAMVYDVPAAEAKAPVKGKAKQKPAAEAKAPAKGMTAADDITDMIRRFKEPRNRMSAYDVVRLAERLEVEAARTLPYEKLRNAIRAAIRARHG